MEAPVESKYVKQKLRIAERDGWICQLCKLPISALSDLSIDHKVPKSRGGTNELTNLQASHKPCNFKKGNRTEELPPEWFNKPFRSKKRKQTVLTKPKEKKKVPDKHKPPPRIITCSAADSVVTELYNEIAVNHYKNLSYKMFKDYFERYHTEKTKGFVLIAHVTKL